MWPCQVGQPVGWFLHQLLLSPGHPVSVGLQVQCGMICLSAVRISQQIGNNIFGNKYFRNIQPPSGFSDGSVVKNLPVGAGDAGLIPGLRRPSGVGYGNPLQDSCMENPMDKNQTWLSTHARQSPSPWIVKQKNSEFAISSKDLPLLWFIVFLLTHQLLSPSPVPSACKYFSQSNASCRSLSPWQVLTIFLFN